MKPLRVRIHSNLFVPFLSMNKLDVPIKRICPHHTVIHTSISIDIRYMNIEYIHWHVTVEYVLLLIHAYKNEISKRKPHTYAKLFKFPDTFCSFTLLFIVHSWWLFFFNSKPTMFHFIWNLFQFVQFSHTYTLTITHKHTHIHSYENTNTLAHTRSQNHSDITKFKNKMKKKLWIFFNLLLFNGK